MHRCCRYFSLENGKQSAVRADPSTATAVSVYPHRKSLILTLCRCWLTTTALSGRMHKGKKPHRLRSDRSLSCCMASYKRCTWLRTPYESDTNRIWKDCFFFVHKALKESDMCHIKAKKKIIFESLRPGNVNVALHTSQCKQLELEIGNMLLEKPIKPRFSECMRLLSQGVSQTD